MNAEQNQMEQLSAEPWESTYQRATRMLGGRVEEKLDDQKLEALQEEQFPLVSPEESKAVQELEPKEHPSTGPGESS